MVRQYKYFKSKNISKNKVIVQKIAPYNHTPPLPAPPNLLNQILLDNNFHFPTISELEAYLRPAQNPSINNPIDYSNKQPTPVHKNSPSKNSRNPQIKINIPPSTDIRQIRIKLINLPINKPNSNDSLARIKFQIQFFE